MAAKKSKEIEGKNFAAIQKICDGIKAKYGKESINFLGNNKPEPMERCTTQCSVLDEATGGGYPIGRIIELFGAESSGKSTLCYHAISAAQKKFPDVPVALIDTEYSFDPIYAANLGVDTKTILVSQPDDGTDGLNILLDLIAAGVKLIIVDSVAALMPKAEAEAGIEQQTVGLQARLMSQALRKITQVVGRSQSTVIFTNQMRDKIGVSYGDKTTTPGGNALKYYASIRIKLQKLGMNSEGDDKVSVRVKATCVKNKTFPPFKECEFVIAFGTGVDELEAALDTIVNNKVVDKKGSWISYKGENICQGRPALKEMLKNNEALKNEMLAAVKGKLVVDAEPTAEEKEDAEADESKAPDVVAPTQDSNAVETGEV